MAGQGYLDNSEEKNIQRRIIERFYYKSNSNIEVRFLLHAKLLGGVFGTNGENIKALERKSCHRVKVRIPFINGIYRVMRITADNWEDIINILDDVCDLCMEGTDENFWTKETSSNCVKLLIHENLCGALVGAGGHRIEKYKNDSGCEKIAMRSKCIPSTTDREIYYIGTPDSIKKAMKFTVEMIPTLNKKPVVSIKLEDVSQTSELHNAKDFSKQDWEDFYERKFYYYGDGDDEEMKKEAENTFFNSTPTLIRRSHTSENPAESITGQIEKYKKMLGMNWETGEGFNSIGASYSSKS